MSTPVTPPAEEAATQKSTVLVATSDATTRALLARALHVGAVEVIDATDGVEALALARRLDLDLILLDAFLAVLDGISVCGRIRALTDVDVPPIIIMGVRSERAVEVALAEGADEILAKPLNPALIRQRARLLLKRRQNERRMRLMERAVQAAATGITILDARSSEYSVAYANPAFSKMTGYAANELHGKNLRILKGPDTDVAAMTELRDAFAAGRDCRVLLKNYRKDGTSFQNDLIAAPMPDQAGRLTHYVAVQYDLTQRLKEHVADKETDIDEMVTARTRELEATATHVEERRRFVETILNSMVSAIVVSDASGVISFANRSALSTLGTSMADCIGRSVPELFGHHEGVVEIVSHTAPARAEYRLDFPFISPGGARLYIGMSVSPVPEEFRAELGYIFLFRDLAETLKDETDPRLLWAQSREGPPAEPGSVAGAEVQKDGADKVPLAEPPVARRRVHLALSFCSPVDLVRAALTGLAGSFAEIETLVKVEAPQELPEGLLDRAQMVEALTHLIGHAVERSGKPEQVHIHIDCERTGALHAPAVRVDVVFPKLAQITERDMSEGAPAEQRSAFRLTDFTSAQRLIEANGGRLLRPPRDGDEQMLSVIMPAAG